MMRRFVARLAIVTELGAAFAGAAVGFRLMLSAIRHARRAGAVSAQLPAAAPTVASDSPPPVAPSSAGVAPNDRRSLVDAVERRGLMDFEPAIEEGDSLRLVISVTVGPPRSEVFVNGRRLGLSPYLGDFSCKRGEPLRVQIVPERGPLMTRRARCRGRTVRIRE